MDSSSRMSAQRAIFIIGTFHKQVDAVYARELTDLFHRIRPTQLLIEKEPVELERGFNDNRPEMKFAHDWARHRNIPVKAFDHKANTLKAGVREKDIAELERQVDEIEHRYGWKAMNRTEIDRKAEAKENEIFDKEKFHRRQHRMDATIQRKMHKCGRILIMTGAGHIRFFRQQFPDAFFLEHIDSMNDAEWTDT